MITLRPYQSEDLDRCRAEYAQGARRVLLVEPTGAGKTIMFCSLIASAAAKGRTVCVLVHRDELVDQVSATLDRFEVAHHVLRAGGQPEAVPVTVASVYTLARRLDSAPAYDLLVIDEAHHATASTWTKICTRFSAAWILGVTATPVRLDGRGLKRWFDVLIEGRTTAWLQEQGHLVSADVYAPASQIDVRGIKTSRGDYAKAELETRAATVTGCAVSEYQSRAAGKRAVVFCVSRKHAAAVCEQFIAAGITAETLTGDLDTAERRARVGRFRAGTTSVLVTVDLISEGFDLPDIEVAIMLRPTASLALYLQQIGRALRPGKPVAIILDHAGNSLRHGLPDEPRAWELTDDRCKATKRRKTVPVKICPRCKKVVRDGIDNCECGHRFISKARTITQRAGGLELLVHSIRRQPIDRPWLQAGWSTSQVSRLSHAQLKAYAEFRGYKRGWVWHQMQRRRGGVA